MTVATGPPRPLGDPAEYTLPNNKTGTWFTGAMHSLNAIVGAGVLSLPWAVAQLGWVAGPLLLLAFFLISRWASILLVELYVVDGLEHARYSHAVKHILGKRGAITAGVFQTVNLVLLCLAYSIIGSESMNYIAVQLGSGFHKQYQMSMLFGVVQVALSQVPNLEKVWWVSLLGSVMSLTYCTVALVLGAVYAGAGQGSVQGVSGLSTAEKAFSCLNALGSIGFAYSVSNVLMEITDTMRQPPSAVAQMKRAVNIALSVAFTFYCGVAVLGYASLGDATPSLVLSGFTDAPQWAVLVAHFAIVVGMMTSWQIFAQPVFDLLESHIKAWRIRREQRRQLSRRQVCPQAAAAAADARSAGRGPASKPAPPPEVAAEEGGASSDDSLESAENSLPSRCRLCGKAVVHNSAPVPDLLPRQGWAHQDSFMRRAHEVEVVEVRVDAGRAAPAAAKPTHATCGGASPLSMVCNALDCTHTSMYCQCPGLANEHVPLNETGYLLPLPQRLVVRTCYVLAITTLAVVAPFVMSVIGLVGSVGWFPLTIAFPILCWIKVHRPRGLRLAAMRAVGVVMLLVAAGATVGALYTMIHSFQTVEFFQ